MTHESLGELLGPSVGPRSHFLPRTPVITLGEEYRVDGGVSPYTNYVAHHEYLHYEQFMTWPFTLTRYANQIFRLSRIFGAFHGIELNVTGFEALTDTQYLLFESRNWDDSRIAAEQSDEFEIGLSALLEGNALLDCFYKPVANEMSQVGTRVVESLLHERDLLRNREHIIGVESCLAVLGLENQDFRDPANRELFRLAASMPGLVMTRTLGAVLRGIGVERLDWHSVNEVIQANLPELLGRYKVSLVAGLREVFCAREGLAWLRCSGSFRDDYIVGCHVMLSCLYRFARGRVPGDAPAFPLLMPQWALLGIIKTFEAMNRRTLARYKAPILFPEYVPVPAFVFRLRSLTAIWIQVEELHAMPTVRLRSAMAHEMSLGQWSGFLSWLSFAVIHEVADCLENHVDDVVCPFWKWIRRNYEELGIARESRIAGHLGKLCNGALRVTVDGEPIHQRVFPSSEYCRCLVSEKPGKIRCLFRSVVDRVLDPVQTVAELEQDVTKRRKEL